MTLAKALIVDDEPDICELLKMTLARMDIDAIDAQDLTSARRLLTKEKFSLCFTDMRLPDGDGIELVEFMQENHPETPIAVITAYGNIEGAVNSLKAGAFDYVSKPVNLNMLRGLVNTALKLNIEDRPSTSSKSTLLGDSNVMEDLRKRIAKVARSQAPVYIKGDSGTGKELVARMIHERSPRKGEPFVPVNCGAIPSELMESEFFGHKKGSFTGAVGDKQGLFQAAHGGTLFLDEVADLPLQMQVKLLRAVQEKAIRPVGAQEEISVDVRILSATHKDLANLVAVGNFRQDLFYRLNVIEIAVPTLNERIEDIPVLTAHFLEKLSAGHQLPKPSLTPASLNALNAYSFPGNIRELENILERAMTLCEDDVIKPEDLQLPDLINDANNNINNDLDNFLENQQRDAILEVLEKTRWNKTAAAKLLGISFRALRYRLKKLDLE